METIRINDNHSTGYSMVGYLCAYMRYYYPTEFCTAYLNCANNEDDIKNGTDLLISKRIKLKKPKFNKALSDFVCDAKNKAIYKGIGSIKNIGNDIGDELSTLYNKNYSSFYSLLSDIKSLSINKSQLTILIKLDYFSQFGHINQLLEEVKIYDELLAIYNKLAVCKQFRKVNCEEMLLPIKDVEACCGKETEKMFKDIDNKQLLLVFKKNYPKILQMISKKYPYKETTIMDKLQYEVELLGYTDLVDENVNPDYYILTGVEENQWGKPFLSLYHISTGFKKVVKSTRKTKKGGGIKWYKSHPIEVGDILDLAFDLDKDGHYEVNGKDKKWVEDETYTEVFVCYEIINKK